MAFVIERARLPLLAALVIGFIAMILTVVAVATEHWIQVVASNEGRLANFGIWQYCILEKCVFSTVTVLAVLTIVTTVLINIAVLATMTILLIQRVPRFAALIPVFLFFVAVIILFADIVVLWPEFSKRPIDSNAITKQQSLVPTTQYGFSSMLLFTTLPLLVVCLVLVSFVAGGLIIKRVVSSNHAHRTSTQTHYY